MHNITSFLILLFVILFLGLSVYSMFYFDFPYYYIGVPGSFILGYIIGDWFFEKTNKKS